MFKILKYSFFDLIRSYWSLTYMLFYLIVTSSLLYFSGDLLKGIISLSSIILILTPLIGTIFGIMYYYNSRDFTELLLAQPIRRKAIFMGQYLGLSLSLSSSFLLGTGLPFLFYGIQVSGEIWNFFTLLLSGALLTCIFTAFAYWIGLAHENRIKGFGLAIVLWLLLALIYDGLFLLSLVLFEEYPIEKLAIGATLFNPIDLSRILVMLKLDISALLGYTGAVFKKFFGTGLGISCSISALIIWVIIPVTGILVKGRKKDF
ncbi:ABC transporter permease [Rapidithrix thailandica]|uniref:ABC transporter permease n=1 Tax=Rapidithrix thailandica TaxID=413964 RepID=A0AAW9S7I9_9BACT